MRRGLSRTAAEDRAKRLAQLTPAERVALAERLGDEGIASFMKMHGLERRTAVARIQAARRLGRRPSRSSAPDAD